jgi:PAS domain S-box-containing protein
VIEFPTSTTLDALVRCRQVVMARTNDVLTNRVAEVPPQDGDAVHSLTALLMTSLEELKVAEEELREQNAALSEIRAAGERRAHHYRQLFLHIPAPALVTDSFATILETNHAAEHLLRRDADHLQRKPFAALLPPSSRADFRTRLNRLVSCEESRHLALTVNRHGDTPIDVDATVSIVPDLEPARSTTLFWLLAVRSPCE